MDLSTDYMGLHLRNPIIVAASPLTTNLGLVQQMEDKGAAAIVMYSLFEEQIHPETSEADGFYCHALWNDSPQCGCNARHSYC